MNYHQYIAHQRQSPFGKRVKARLSTGAAAILSETVSTASTRPDTKARNSPTEPFERLISRYLRRLPVHNLGKMSTKIAVSPCVVQKRTHYSLCGPTADGTAGKFLRLPSVTPEAKNPRRAFSSKLKPILPFPVPETKRYHRRHYQRNHVANTQVTPEKDESTLMMMTFGKFWKSRDSGNHNVEMFGTIPKMEDEEETIKSPEKPAFADTVKL